MDWKVDRATVQRAQDFEGFTNIAHCQARGHCFQVTFIFLLFFSVFSLTGICWSPKAQAQPLLSKEGLALQLLQVASLTRATSCGFRHTWS